MSKSMSEIEQRVAQQAELDDEELPIAPDPNLKFWKQTAKGLLTESIKSIEEAAKQIIGVTGVLEGLYFHAIAYSDVRVGLKDWEALVYILPLLFWLVSLGCALLVFFPSTYDANINSWRESRATFEKIVRRKHMMLKAAGATLALGALFLPAALGIYLG